MTKRNPSLTLYLHKDKVLVAPVCTEISGKPFLNVEHIVVDASDRNDLHSAIWRAFSLVRYDYPDTGDVPPDRDKTVVKKLGFPTWIRMCHASKVISVSDLGIALSIVSQNVFKGSWRTYKTSVESTKILIDKKSPDLMHAIFKAFETAEL